MSAVRPDRVTRALEQPPAGQVQRLALSKAHAALAIDCSVDFLEEHVLPTLRVIRRGRKVLIPVRELERWLEREAALTIGES